MMLELVRFEWVAMTAGEDVFCRQADVCIGMCVFCIRCVSTNEY